MTAVSDNQETLRRGQSLAAGGLVIQVVLLVATAAAAVWTANAAFSAAAWHMLGGLPIWILLVIYFGQREVEARETLASERIAGGDAASALLFGELSDELQRARQRVTNLVAYGLPAVSIFIGGSLLFGGGILLWRFLAGGLLRGDAAAKPVHPVGLLFITAGIAFVAFVAGRWISGCARAPAWRLLRGGASYLMSCFLVAGLLLAAATVAAFTSVGHPFGLVALAIPAVMIAIGSEILLTSVLELYRPRRLGELPRPAFESRLLGLLTTPESLGDVLGELIRYQFGVEVSGSWFYRLLGRAIGPLALFALAILAALSCLVVIGPDEEGVVLHWGAIKGPARPAGVHFKLPWPIETAAAYPTRRILQLSVSSDLAGIDRGGEAILWTGGDDRLAHLGQEYYPAPLSATGGGMAVVAIDAVVQYRIRDLLSALQTAPDATAAIAAISQQELTRYAASHDLGFLLSQGRVDAGPDLAARLQARIDALRLGVEVVDVSITSLRPPGAAVARAFHRQIAAGEERQTLIERARRTAVATLTAVAGSVAIAREIDAAILEVDAARTGSPPAAAADLAGGEAAIDALLATARGEAAERIHAARGSRWTRNLGERAAQERFAGELLAYDHAPEYYQARRFLDVLAAGLADRRKVVVAGSPGSLPVLRMDFADPASAIETLLGD